MVGGMEGGRGCHPSYAYGLLGIARLSSALMASVADSAPKPVPPRSRCFRSAASPSGFLLFLLLLVRSRCLDTSFMSLPLSPPLLNTSPSTPPSPPSFPPSRANPPPMVPNATSTTMPHSTTKHPNIIMTGDIEEGHILLHNLLHALGRCRRLMVLRLRRRGTVCDGHAAVLAVVLVLLALVVGEPCCCAWWWWFATEDEERLLAADADADAADADADDGIVMLNLFGAGLHVRTLTCTCTSYVYLHSRWG
mmetsp:Transcript_12926/g.27918  ORF Transcript_12926/g.27918 Transcript_12926/m.27918 type:complete len:251 (+) Transcript_12926:2-754(+)